MQIARYFAVGVEQAPDGEFVAGHKNTVLTLVERGGAARSFHIESTSYAQIVPIIRANISRETALNTDDARHYMAVGREFASHEAVNHSADEYVRGDAHTNTVEGYYISRAGLCLAAGPNLRRDAGHCRYLLMAFAGGYPHQLVAAWLRTRCPRGGFSRRLRDWTSLRKGAMSS
jgi:hypothetical protein